MQRSADFSKLVLVGARSRAAKALKRKLGHLPTVGIARAAARGDLDVADYRTVPDALDMEGALVVNCVGTDQGTAEELHRVNCEVALAYAHAASQRGAARFVQLSSFSVFAPTVVARETTPLAPQTDYGRSKLAAERALEDFSPELEKIAILRVPILVAAPGTGAIDKLTRLMRVLTRFRAIPRPLTDIRRSMLTYAGLAEAISLVASRDGIFHAADPQLFSYSLLAAISAEEKAGMHAIPVPLPIEGALRLATPGLHARLFTSMYLDPDINLLADRTAGSFHPDLAEIVRQHLVRH